MDCVNGFPLPLGCALKRSCSLDRGGTLIGVHDLDKGGIFTGDLCTG